MDRKKLGVIVAALALLALVPVAHEQWVEGQAKTAVAHDLSDPASAQFRGMHVSARAVCGEINAKNRMGAYVGYKAFFVDRATGKAEIVPDETSAAPLTPSSVLEQLGALERWYDRRGEMCFGIPAPNRDSLQ